LKIQNLGRGFTKLQLFSGLRLACPKDGQGLTNFISIKGLKSLPVVVTGSYRLASAFVCESPCLQAVCFLTKEEKKTVQNIPRIQEGI
jgi:hypothetical protein